MCDRIRLNVYGLLRYNINHLQCISSFWLFFPFFFDPKKRIIATNFTSRSLTCHFDKQGSELGYQRMQFIEWMNSEWITFKLWILYRPIVTCNTKNVIHSNVDINNDSISFDIVWVDTYRTLWPQRHLFVEAIFYILVEMSISMSLSQCLVKYTLIMKYPIIKF